MVLDSSAIVAVMLQEPEADLFAAKIAEAEKCQISAANYLECAMALMARRGIGTERELDFLFEEAGIEIVPVSVAHARMARHAFRRYGKGRHPAGLNFGDCFSYALAKSTGEPLLFKGDDFSRTDVEVA